MYVETFTRHLANGLTIVALPRPHANTAMVCADLRVGARYERPDDSGLSHFLEHMIFQGCEGYPTAEAFNGAAELLGAAPDASTGRDTTRFEHWIAPERLDESLALMAAMLRAPLFAEIEAERAIILEEALDELDEDGRLVGAETLSRRDLWPESALGQSVIGRRENLRRFGLDDLRRHHRQHFVARNMVVTAVGPQSGEELLDAVERQFAAHPAGERVEPDPPGRLPGRARVRFVRDARSQCDCRLVFRTPGELDADAAAILVLRVMLDDGLSSRLQRRLSTQLGLAYDLWASWERYPDTGALEVGAQVSPRKVPTFVEEALAVLAGLAREPPGPAELERVHFRARWALMSCLDFPEALAGLIGTPRLYIDEPPDLPSRLAAIEAVTAEDVERVARRVLDPSGLCACIVGRVPRPAQRRISEQVGKFCV